MLKIVMFPFNVCLLIVATVVIGLAGILGFIYGMASFGFKLGKGFAELAEAKARLHK
jgi:hypothetical protein